ncbi:MAG: MgtC/SapB family protein [Candidatus Parcubacteria bacterium]|nr:MgtC/SapB family protein [Candidatus Parcubacteria bacterium]
MVTSDIAFQLILALLFGAAIGLERESSQDSEEGSVGGMRTYSLFSLLGAVSGILYMNHAVLLASAVAIVFFCLVLSGYIVSTIRTGDFGMTTEVTILFTFIIGLFPMLNIMPLHLVVALFVVFLTILSIKAQTKMLVAAVTTKELHSFIKYGIISLVILPFLPNAGYSLESIPLIVKISEGLHFGLGQLGALELINPQKLWLVVVLITGIDVFGHVLRRVIGDKGGFTVSSFFGGFISSTLFTQSMAKKSRKLNKVNSLIGAALLANAASFVEVFLIVTPLNGKWLITIFPSLVIMMITAALFAFYFLRKHDPEEQDESGEIKTFKIFSIESALKFAVLLTAVKLMTKVCLLYFGQTGFLLSAVFASFFGMGAIIISIAEMAGTAITLKFALLAFLLINTTNLASKAATSYFFGNRQFARSFLISVAVVVLVSFAGLLLVP